jgi:hypothetical protein
VTTGKVSAGSRFARACPAETDLALAWRNDDLLVAAIVSAIRAEVPAFRTVSLSELRRIVSADLFRGEAAMQEGRPPTEDELEQFAVVMAQLARAGIPMEACIQARGVAMRRFLDDRRARAREAGVDDATQIEFVYALWNWADAVLVRSSAAYNDAAREIAGTQDDRRSQFLRGLLEGTLERSEAPSRAAAYGLLPGGRYMAGRGRVAPTVDSAQLVRSIETTGRADGRGALVAILDGEVCGVVSNAPQVSDGAVLGLGPAVELGDLHESFRLAGRALDTAVAFGLRGVAHVDALSLRPAILTEDHAGETLVGRYLEPLQALGEFGETLERTVRQYLACGMRVEGTAKTLIVHPNTLRHRLERFQELTGADLRRTEDLVEVWWALERRSIAQTRAVDPSNR